MITEIIKFNDLDFLEESNNNCCEAPNIISIDGYYTCTNCGTTISRIIEYSAKSAFTKEEKDNRQMNERVYCPIGPRTVIKDYKDTFGNYLKPSDKMRFERLAKINRGLINGYERNLWIALPIFYRLQHLLKIPSYVSEDAFKIYRQTIRLKLTLGRSIVSLLTASVYCAIRLHKLPIFLEEIIQYSQLSKKELYKSFKVISINILPILNIKLKNIEPELYVDRIQEILKLSMKTRNLAIKILKSSKKKGLKFSGKDPRGFTAAALYISSKINGESCLQKDLCEAAIISEVTLRNRVNDFKKFNDIKNHQLNGILMKYDADRSIIHRTSAH